MNKRTIISTLLLLIICGNTTAAANITFHSIKVGQNNGFTFYKIEYGNTSPGVQAIVTASDYENFFFSERDTLEQQKWKIDNDTAVFRFDYIANGLHCEFCKAKAIILLPGDIKEYYLKVPDVANNRILQVSTFSIENFCYSLFLQEIKGVQWEKKYKIEKMPFLLD